MQQHVMLGTRRVVYLEGGSPDGRALVWLHAFPLSAGMFHAQLLGAPDGWRVVAPDLAGLGATDDYEGSPPSLEDYARDVLGLLDALGIRQAVVGGVSLGGYVALAVWRLGADRLTGLVLADTKAAADTETAREGRAHMLEVLEARGPDGVADEMLGALLGETTRRTRPGIVSDVKALVLGNRPEGIRRAILRLRDRPDATPALRAIAVPTLVLVGAEDSVTPRADAESLANAIPGASFELIGEAGHLACLEQPEAFNAAVRAFLARIAVPAD
jgi:3-oxoadipate enol-lactonase